MKRNRLFALLLAFLMLTGMVAACGEAPAPAGTSTSTTASESAAASSDPAPAESSTTPEVSVDPFMKYDPPIEITVVKPADSFFGYSEEQTASDNDVYKLWEDVVGIKFVNKVETSSEAYPQKVRLLISSNDIPDLIGTSAADFAEMSRNDMLQDLKPYMDSYMSPRTKEAFGAFEGKLFGPVTYGESVYGLPATSNVEGSLRNLWIRKDWLEAVGMPVPKTMEEVLDLAVAFTTQDPDKNGKDDTFGLPLDKDLTTSLINTLDVVSNAFGYYPSRIIKNASGDIVLGSMDSGMKTVMQKFQDFYKQGVFDPEFASKDFMQVDADVGAGKIGLWPGVFWKPVDPGFAATYNDGVEWITAAIPQSSTVDAYRPYVPFPANSYYGMSVKYDHPEALLVLANHFMDEDLSDKDGWAYNWMEVSNKHSGIPTNNWSPVQWQDPLFFDATPLKKALADKEWDRLKPKFRVHGQAYDILSGFTPEGGTPADPVTVRQFTDIFLGAIGETEKYDANGFVFDAYYGAPTETQKKQGSILSKMETEAFVQIISGSKPVDFYDTFMENYMKQGGEAIINEIKAELAK